MGGMKKGNDVRRMNILHPTTSNSRYPKTADQTPPTLYIMDDIITISSRIPLLEISSAIRTQWTEKLSPTENPMRALERRSVV